MFKLSQLLFNPKKARRHPIEIVLLGIFYSSISLLISAWVFPDYSSLFMVFLTVISCLYVVEGALIREEKIEKNINSEKKILKSHFRTLWFFVLIFLGFLISFSFWTIVLPQDIVDNLFKVQDNAYQRIRVITGNAVSDDAFETILFNNIRVLVFSLILALFYGAGAIFVLAWNASIMGFVIGNLGKNILGLAHLPRIFLKYFLHGIPEMLSYFAAALAGGILFVSVIKGDFNSERSKRIITDVIILIGLSVLILILAALIEVNISPYV
jgi:uncharacterized membrane protein SpoIIM required for sporulation